MRDREKGSRKRKTEGSNTFLLQTDRLPTRAYSLQLFAYAPYLILLLIPACSMQITTGGYSYCRNTCSSKRTTFRQQDQVYCAPNLFPDPTTSLVTTNMWFMCLQRLAVRFEVRSRLQGLWQRWVCLIINQPKSRHTPPITHLGTRKACPICSALR